LSKTYLLAIKKPFQKKTMSTITTIEQQFLLFSKPINHPAYIPSEGEVHCAKGAINQDGSYAMEISILFNNERLRQHGVLNSIYQVIRRLIYGRVMDLESFKILVAPLSANGRFVFEGIYSNNEEMNADSIHGDRSPPPAPEHPVKYYFVDRNHPVVFINTSNHAMAECGTNNRIWKWEYIPWLADAPIKLGSLTRKEIEQSFKKRSSSDSY